MTAETKPGLKSALEVADTNYGAANAVEIPGRKPFGEIIPLTDDEARQLAAVRDLVARFLRQSEPARPLCLAVFGPPGSGKSFAVRQVQTEVQRGVDVQISATTINLTQVADAVELGSALRTALNGPGVPLVFFDEFDATRDGSPYGWLSWLLSPMHDGEFFHQGEVVKKKRAIYVFAGGTSSTMGDFAARQGDPAFRSAKGPDFVSRLRGYLNVPGPNSSPREVRRALILRGELERRVKRHGTGTFRLDRAVLESLLRVGRYRHGARSIAALVELIALDENKPLLDWSLLPDDHLLAMHVDRGPLDPTTIDGAIALSGFHPVEGDPGADSAVAECWTSVAEALWDEGATIAYAGQWKGPRGTLSRRLLDELERRATELSADPDVRARPAPRFRSFLHGFSTQAEVGELETALPTRRKIGIDLVVGDYLSAEERAWGRDDWRARVVERFRRRLASSEASVARFVVGGNPKPFGNRPSGIVEETIISLALGQPVYVAGGFGGAARDVGSLLGLSEIRSGQIPESLQDVLTNEEREWLLQVAARLRPPPLNDLPVLPLEQVAFLKAHAVGGRGWIDNGLSAAENRALFTTASPARAAQLTTTGLLRRFRTE